MKKTSRRSLNPNLPLSGINPKVDIPGQPEPTGKEPQLENERKDLAKITLRVTPDPIYERDEITIRWEVKQYLNGKAWPGAIQFSSSPSIEGLPNTAPGSGSFSYTAGAVKAGKQSLPVTVTLTVGTPLAFQREKIKYRIERLPSPRISSLSSLSIIGEFNEEINIHPGDWINIVGSDFRKKQAGDKILLTMHGRVIELDIRDWTDRSILAIAPADVPVVNWAIFGHGTLQVVKALPGRGEFPSNELPIEMVRSVAKPAPVISFGAPRIVRPESENGSDLSDHFGLAVDITYRPHPAVELETHRLVPQDPVTFTLFTYNIAQVPDPVYEGRRDRMYNIDGIAEHLNTADYGIVCIQEAFANEAIKRLRRKINHTYPYQEAGPRGELLEQESGLLILSRFRITAQNRKKFPGGSLFAVDFFAAKGVLHTHIQVGADPADSIDVFTSHTHSTSEDIRADQFKIIRDFIAEHRQTETWILAGDLNVNGTPAMFNPGVDTEYRRMLTLLDSPRDLWAHAFFQSKDPGYTYDTQDNSFAIEKGKEKKRYDYILTGMPDVKPAPPAVKEE